MKTHIQFLVLLSCIFISSCSSDDSNTPNPPSNSTLEVSIDEYPSSGDLITTVTSSLSGDLTYTITSLSIAQALDINSSNGQLRVLNWQVFDYEINPVITVTVDISNGTDTENKVVIISITNTDDILSFLNTSRTAYINASSGQWISITEGEYYELANNLANVTRSGQTDAIFQSSATILTGGANYTVTNNLAPTLPSGSYLFAFRYYTNENNTVDSNVKISETSYQNNFEIVGTNLPEHNSGYNYFVMKGSNAPTNSTAYLGIYESNTIGYKSSSVSTYFYEPGDTEDLTNESNNRTYLYQGLSTTIKQWD